MPNKYSRKCPMCNSTEISRVDEKFRCNNCQYTNERFPYQRKRRFFSIKERETILLKKGKFCDRCGRKDKLNIHHIDWNRDNNKDENLGILCRECHKQIHTPVYEIVKDENGNALVEKYLPLAYAVLKNKGKNFPELLSKFKRGELPVPSIEETKKIIGMEEEMGESYF